MNDFRAKLEDAIYCYASMEVDAAEYFMCIPSDEHISKTAMDYHRNRSKAAWEKVAELLDKIPSDVV